MMTWLRRSLCVLLLGVSAATVFAGQVGAQAATPTDTSLTLVGAAATRTKGQLALTATLRTAEGKPLGEQVVDFYLGVRFFGPRDAHLGSATTDSTGTAVLAYQPAQAGTHVVTVHFAGSAVLAQASGSGSIDVREVVAPFAEDPLPFVLVSRWLPFALGALVIATWTVLVGVFLRTVIGIRAAGRGAEAPRQLTIAAITEIQVK